MRTEINQNFQCAVGHSKLCYYQKESVKSHLCEEFAYEEDDNVVDDEDYEPEYDVKNTVTKKLRKLKKIEENLSNDVGSEAFKTLETDLNAFQGAKYLGFFLLSFSQNERKMY